MPAKKSNATGEISDREIVISRVINAPRELVWNAFIEMDGKVYSLCSKECAAVFQKDPAKSAEMLMKMQEMDKSEEGMGETK